MKQGKIRLDAALVERGLCQTRTNAQALIMAGEVRVNGQSVLKASHQVKPEDILTLKEKLKYVSRGGLKLEKALRVFPIDVQGAVCVDVHPQAGLPTACCKTVPNTYMLWMWGMGKWPILYAMMNV